MRRCADVGRGAAGRLVPNPTISGLDVRRDSRVGMVGWTDDLGLFRARPVIISNAVSLVQRRRRLRRSLEAKHALIPSIDGEPVSVLAGFLRPFCRRPD